MHRDVLLELASRPSGNVRELNQLRQMAAVTDRAPHHRTPGMAWPPRQGCSQALQEAAPHPRGACQAPSLFFT